jgi:hypothetical protein
MKWILLYDTKTKRIVIQEQMADDTRPLFNPNVYSMLEFDTEAEMHKYIADNGLVNSEATPD